MKGLDPLTRVDTSTVLSAVWITPRQYGAIGDGSSHTITSGDITAHTEWVGTYASGDQWDYVGLQEAIYAAYGTNRTNASGLWINNRTLHIEQGTYLLNNELKCYHLIGFRWEGEQKFGTSIVQTATNKRIIDGQSVSYGVFSNILFSTNASQNLPLIDLDYDGSQGSDLRPQNITFHDCVFQGNGVGYVGVQIAKTSGAQGDNIRFYNCYGNGFSQSVYMLGAGANGTASQLAFNAINVEFRGGDIQGCPAYGISSYGGSIFVEDVSFENSTGTGSDQTGYDVLVVSGVLPSTARNCSSESTRFSSGVAFLDNIQLRPNGAGWYNTNTSNSFPGATLTLGRLVTGTTIGGDGAFYKVTTAGTVGGLTYTAVSSATANTLTVTGAGWTTNQFAGMKASILDGTGSPAGLFGSFKDGSQAQSLVISSNTSTTLTLATNWTVQPTSSSHFVIEPDWNRGVIAAGAGGTGGTAVLTFYDYFVATGAARISNSSLPGGKIGLSTPTYGAPVVIVDNIFISRTDALAPIYDGSSYNQINGVFVTNGPELGQAPLLLKKWYLPSTGGDLGSALLKDYSQFNLGAQKIAWSQAAVSDPNSRYADVWIGRGDGIRGDDGSATTRNVLGFGGTLGRETPIGLNQSATLPTRIQGQLSTGTGTPTGIEFLVGAAGSSGSTPNDGAAVAGIGANRIFWSFKGADVASAATITPTGNLFHCTGTTNIDNISLTGISAGTELTIIFDGVLTVNDGTGNLKLASNFVTTADDTLTIKTDGTSWYEVCRSVN